MAQIVKSVWDQTSLSQYGLPEPTHGETEETTLNQYKHSKERMRDLLSNLHKITAADKKKQHQKKINDEKSNLEKIIINLRQMAKNNAANAQELQRRNQGLYALEMWVRCAHLTLVTGDQENLAKALGAVAIISQEIGRFRDAINCHLASKEIKARLFGEESSQCADSVNNVANVYFDMAANGGDAEESGKYLDEAMKGYQKALEMKIKLFGAESLEATHVINNIANVYFQLDKFPEAMQEYTKTLQLYTQKKGPGSPEVADTLNNIANVLRSQGNHAEALKTLAGATEIYSKVFGPVSPQVASVKGFMGLDQFELGEYQQALKFYIASLEIFDKIYSKLNNESGKMAENIGKVHEKLGNQQLRLKFLERSLECYKAAFGVKHADYLRVKNDVEECKRLLEGTQSESTSAETNLNNDEKKEDHNSQVSENLMQTRNEILEILHQLDKESPETLNWEILVNKGIKRTEIIDNSQTPKPQAKQIAGITLIAEKDGKKYELTGLKRNGWAGVGTGKMEDSESPVLAAIREFKEEFFIEHLALDFAGLSLDHGLKKKRGELDHYMFWAQLEAEDMEEFIADLRKRRDAFYLQKGYCEHYIFAWMEDEMISKLAFPEAAKAKKDEEEDHTKLVPFNLPKGFWKAAESKS